MSLSLFSKISGAGEPLVLLHGLFGSADNLGRISARLSSQFEVHSLDLRNHGNSPHSSEMDYQAMAEDVVTYLDKKGFSSTSLLGHSMGGKVAMKVALSNPERVKKLIVADIAPVTYAPSHEQIFKALFSVDLPSIRSRSDAYAVLSESIEEESVRQLMLKSLKREKTVGFVWKLNLQSIYDNYSKILSGLSADNAYHGKVLFIAGGLSDYLKPSDKNITLSLFPNATTKIIPDATHWLHIEKPKLFSSICERFLND